jgi:hypothetical protein
LFPLHPINGHPEEPACRQAGEATRDLSFFSPIVQRIAPARRGIAYFPGGVYVTVFFDA